MLLHARPDLGAITQLTTKDSERSNPMATKAKKKPAKKSTPPAARKPAKRAAAKPAKKALAKPAKEAPAKAVAQPAAKAAAKPAKKARKPTRGPKVTPIPQGFPAVSAHLTVSNVKQAAELYCKVFGFSLMGPMMMVGKQAIHAVLTHAGCTVMLGGPAPDGSHASPAAQQLRAQAFGLYVYVKDVDAQFKQVKRFKSLQVTPPQDTFWGDRIFDVVDRDGHRWTFASCKRLPSPEEMAAALQQMMG